VVVVVAEAVATWEFTLAILALQLLDFFNLAARPA
jgi:hypothetical protein